MKCANCRKTIRDPYHARDFGSYWVCEDCFGALRYLTRETGSENRTIEELSFEIEVDTHVAWEA